jgi:hypothetical protein
MDQEQRNRIARRIRARVEKLAEEKARIPSTKADLRRILGYTDRRTMETRWLGETEYTVAELVRIAEALDVRVADLTHADEDDD